MSKMLSLRGMDLNLPSWPMYGPGTFRMGSPTGEVDRNDWEGPQTAVTISRGFLIGKYEVTQGEYLAVTGTNPSSCQPPHFAEDLSRPVELVTWLDATNYCGLLTERERAAGRISTNSVYRLPTEAECEYACRGWTSTRFSHGDDVGYAGLTNFAWYADKSESMPHPVGQKLPNPGGLYDMHGNVREWCQSPCLYAGGIALDPEGPITSWTRAWRGGSFAHPASECRSAYRGNSAPSDSDSTLGFRVVLAPAQP